jgi:hypothetical protein
MSGMALGGVLATVNGFNAPLSHQGRHVSAADGDALKVQQVAQHPTADESRSGVKWYVS